MLSLTDNGRTTVVWGDFKCTLDLAFDRVLSFLQVIEDDSLSSNEKTLKAVQLFLGERNETIDHLLGRLPKDDSFFEEVFKIIISEIKDEPYGKYEDSDDEAVDKERIFDWKRELRFEERRLVEEKEHGRPETAVFLNGNRSIEEGKRL